MNTWGSGFTIYTAGNSAIRYELQSSGDAWSMQSYGWHGTAALVCEFCDDRNTAWGLVHLSDQAERRVVSESHPSQLLPLSVEAEGEVHRKVEYAEILNSTDRVLRGAELIYYPLTALRKHELKPVFKTDEVRLGSFTGYGVVYELTVAGKLRMPETIDGIIAFGVSDGCAHFTGTVAAQWDNAEFGLKLLLESFSIQRKDLANLEAIEKPSLK